MDSMSKLLEGVNLGKCFFFQRAPTEKLMFGKFFLKVQEPMANLFWHLSGNRSKCKL